MDKKDTKLIKDLIHRLGLKYRLSDEVVKKIIDSPDEFTNKVIREISILEVKNEEEFNKLQTNFYYIGLGKLHIPYYTVERKNNKQKFNLNKTWTKTS